MLEVVDCPYSLPPPRVRAALLAFDFRIAPASSAHPVYFDAHENHGLRTTPRHACLGLKLAFELRKDRRHRFLQPILIGTVLLPRELAKRPYAAILDIPGSYVVDLVEPQPPGRLLCLDEAAWPDVRRRLRLLWPQDFAESLDRLRHLLDNLMVSLRRNWLLEPPVQPEVLAGLVRHYRERDPAAALARALEDLRDEFDLSERDGFSGPCEELSRWCAEASQRWAEFLAQPCGEGALARAQAAVKTTERFHALFRQVTKEAGQLGRQLS